MEVFKGCFTWLCVICCFYRELCAWPPLWSTSISKTGLCSTISTDSLFQLLLESFINIFQNFKTNALSPILFMYSSTSLCLPFFSFLFHFLHSLHFFSSTFALDVNSLEVNWREQSCWFSRQRNCHSFPKSSKLPPLSGAREAILEWRIPSRITHPAPGPFLKCSTADA